MSWLWRYAAAKPFELIAAAYLLPRFLTKSDFVDDYEGVFLRNLFVDYSFGMFLLDAKTSCPIYELEDGATKLFALKFFVSIGDIFAALLALMLPG